MRPRRPFEALALLGLLVPGSLFGCTRPSQPPPDPPKSTASGASDAPPGDKVVRTEEEWKKVLSSDAYHVLREKGTEPAFSGKYHDDHSQGTYVCGGCGQPLFSSDHKFDSGTGWPSFYQPTNPQAVTEHVDSTYGMTRTEVTCSRCGGHLGHVFDDGPPPTGKRFCINSVSLWKK